MIDTFVNYIFTLKVSWKQWFRKSQKQGLYLPNSWGNPAKMKFNSFCTWTNDEQPWKPCHLFELKTSGAILAQKLNFGQWNNKKVPYLLCTLLSKMEDVFTPKSDDFQFWIDDLWSAYTGRMYSGWRGNLGFMTCHTQMIPFLKHVYTTE